MSAKESRLKLSRRFIVTVIAVGATVLLGVGLFLFARSYSSGTLPIIGGGASPENEVESLVKTVGEKVLLPNEVPTIATVSDKSQLADEVFFQNAENGDKVLIYSNARIAVIYRPSIDKIINIGPVNLQQDVIDSQNEASQSAVLEEEVGEVNVVILNGTTTVGLTQDAADELADLEFVTVEDRDDAVNKPYEETAIVNLGSNTALQAQAIADVFSAPVVSALPDGETATGEIIIILGEDYASN